MQGFFLAGAKGPPTVKPEIVGHRYPVGYGRSNRDPQTQTRMAENQNRDIYNKSRAANEQIPDNRVLVKE